MINFPKKILVGKNNSTVSSAVICPVGTTSGEKKKMQNVKTSHANCEEFDNIPLPGFTLQDGGHYYKDVWPVIDPRGFIVYIERSNLDKILSVTGITEGLIQQMCVWARDNSGVTMTLVPVTSKDFNKFSENTELLGNKPSLRDVKIGDKVKLQNELEGIYYGSFNLHGPMQINSDEMVMQEVPKRHVVEVDGKWFYHSSNPSVVKIIERASTEMSKEDAEEYLCQAAKNVEYFSSTVVRGNYQYWSTRGMIKHVTSSKDTPTIELEETSIDEFKNYSARTNNNYSTTEYDRYLVEDANGKKYLLEYKYGGIDAGYCYLSAVKSIETNKIVYEMQKDNRYNRYTRKSQLLPLDSLVKCYRIIKTINQEEKF